MQLAKSRFSLPSIILATLVFSCFLGACSSQMAEKVRKVTYPQNFKYVAPAELRTNMDRLAQHMRLLDLSLAMQHNQSAEGIETQRQQVLTALANIERIGSALQAGDGGSNHPFLESHMRDFVSNVGAARVAASLPQPRYYLAGKVSGGCVNCHRINR